MSNTAQRGCCNELSLFTHVEGKVMTNLDLDLAPFKSNFLSLAVTV